MSIESTANEAKEKLESSLNDLVRQRTV